MQCGIFSSTVDIKLVKTLNEDGSNLQMISDRVFYCDQAEVVVEVFQNILPLHVVVLLQQLVE